MTTKPAITAADAIRRVAEAVGLHQRNDFIVKAVYNRFRRVVSQTQVVQAIGCWKNRKQPPGNLRRLARLYLTACSGDQKLASTIIRSVS